MEPERRFDGLALRLDLARLVEPDLRCALVDGLDRAAAFVERLDPFFALALEPLDDPLLDRLRGLLVAGLLFAILIPLLGRELPPERRSTRFRRA